ncbi:hypothetical protein C8Q73DRAFT_655815 [Cubamyces lactineus]|nr:hypothetical protein C8Q73DRAFT_655815 [Cubamyces lactineus]
MSSTSSLEHLYPVLRDADISFFISCAATALAYYEYLITIRLEVQQIWNRDASGATILFVMTRYFMLLDRVFVVIGLYPIRDPGVSAYVESCCLGYLLLILTIHRVSVVFAAIAAIRIFALWNRDYSLLVIVILTGIFPAFANLFLRSASTVYIIPANFYTCQYAPTAVTAQTYKALSIATRVISIVSDGIVVVLTWVKTYRVYAITRRVRFRADYSALILRDGKCRIATCVLNLVAIIYIWMTGTNLLNDLIVTLSAILMARFLLNLRDQRSHIEDMSFTWGNGGDGDSKLSLSQPLSSLRFASVSGLFDTMGTMGGSVSTGSQVGELGLPEGDEEIGGLDSAEPPGSAGTSEATCVASDDLLHEKEVQKVPEGASAWA